jgi:hypothetical protein
VEPLSKYFATKLPGVHGAKWKTRGDIAQPFATSQTEAAARSQEFISDESSALTAGAAHAP